MIAALPMYDNAATMAANDRYWALIADELHHRGIPAPASLRRGDADLMMHWLHPDLLLSQTCGFPFRARLHDRVTLIGTPDFGVEGCPPGHYRSVLIVRADDPRPGLAAFDGARLAYNDALSQSGWAAPQTFARDRGITLQPGPCTGAHSQSLLAVAQGRADIAALDAVTWSLLAEADPATAAQVRILDHTPPTPGLPYITAQGRDPAPLFDAIAAAIPRLSPEDRTRLRLRGLVRIPAAAYLAVPTPPAPALVEARI